MAKRLLPIRRADNGEIVALVCTKCAEEKPSADFHRSSAAKYGFRMPCKACQRVSRAARQRKWRANNPEKHRQMLTAWHAKNPTYERERSKFRYHTDLVFRERTRAAARAWAREHPEYYRAAAKLRRARMANVACTLTVEQAKELFDEYAGLCVYCMMSATTLDHIVPISSGGAHAKDNLVPACKSCNSRKHDKPLLVFLARRKVA